MKIRLHYFIIIFYLTLLSQKLFAQAPNISYSTPNNIYTVGFAIPALSPTNTGGAIPASASVVTTLVASGAGLANPQAITSDIAGNIYVADANNNKIRKVTPAGVMTTLAGSGAAGFANGTGAAAQFSAPDGLVYDGAGNLYVADAGNNRIRKIVIATGVVTTFAGTGASSPITNATALTSTFNGPAGISLDPAGDMFVADQGNNLIREISASGTVTTLAGSGSDGSENGIGVLASFNSPNDLVADGSGNVYVADYLNSLVRKIVVSTQTVTTLAGSGVASWLDGTGNVAEFNRLASLTIDAAGNLIIADLSNYRIRLVTTAGVVYTIAGTGAGAETDGIGTAAAFNNTGGIHSDKLGNCYIVDYPTTSTGTVRKMVVGGYAISPSALPAGLSFNSATGTLSGTPAASFAATTYNIIGLNASGSSSTAITIACGASVLWTGNTNGTWATGTNWNTGAAPNVNDAVSIGVNALTGAKKDPIITTTVTVGSITFGNNGGNHTLTLTSPGILNIGGYLTVPTAVTSTLTGTGALNIAPGAIININGTGVLTTNLTGRFTLQSNATGSASVGQILTTSINGTGADSIHVERYITGGVGYRGYRLVSSPVYTATVNPNNVYGINYLSNSIYVLGSTGIGGGFNKAGNPTLFLYREDQTPSNTSFTSGNFWGISAVNNVPSYNYYMNGGSTIYNIPVGNGMMFFFRGNRGAATLATETVSAYTAAPTATLSAYGTLNAGQITVHNWYTPGNATIGYTGSGPGTNFAVRGFNLVGNPYASSIDWEQFNTTTTSSGIYGSNIGNMVYEFNPATNSYATYQVGGANTNNGQRTITSGEGFFVLASNTNPKLIFNESAKVTTQNTGLNLLMAAKADVALVTNNIDQHLRLQLAVDSINTDDIYIGFNKEASNDYVFNEDAPYKSGAGKVSLSSFSSDNVALAINKLPLPKLKQTVIRLSVATSAYGLYKLNMTELKGIPEIFEIWLKDLYKKDSLDMRHNETYAFNLTTDTGSYGSYRFQLVIRQNPALGIHLLSFTATKETDGAQIVWKTENEENYTNFTVEKSTDNGATYNEIDGFTSSALGTYSFLDKNPFPVTKGTVNDKYRLKIEDLNGTVSYSESVTLTYSSSSNKAVNNNIQIYPNPASSFINLTIGSNTLSLNTSNLTSSLSSYQTPGTGQEISTINNSPVYGIKIMNMAGSVIKTATSASADWQANVSNLSPGTYIIHVVNNVNNSLVGESTFVKL